VRLINGEKIYVLYQFSEYKIGVQLSLVYRHPTTLASLALR